jgi:hypothetical protein
MLLECSCRVVNIHMYADISAGADTLAARAVWLPPTVTCDSGLWHSVQDLLGAIPGNWAPPRQRQQCCSAAEHCGSTHGIKWIPIHGFSTPLLLVALSAIDRSRLNRSEHLTLMNRVQSEPESLGV